MMHLSKRYGLDRSCDSSSRARVSEAWASLHALWIWYTLKQLRPTLLLRFMGSSMKSGSNLCREATKVNDEEKRNGRNEE